MKTVKVTNIKYDTDGEDVDLPKEIKIEIPHDVASEGKDAIDDYVSDEISNNTGFCHNGFDSETLKDKFNIEIEIKCDIDDEIGFEMSLNEAVKKIKEGYLLGRDGNNDEEYSFAVKKNK